VIDEQTMTCIVGEDIELITINKRDEADVAKLLARSQAKLVDTWKHQSFAWNKFIHDRCRILSLTSHRLVCNRQ